MKVRGSSGSLILGTFTHTVRVSCGSGATILDVADWAGPLNLVCASVARSALKPAKLDNKGY